SARSSSQIFARAAGSRPVVGSSRNSTPGRGSSARAMSTRGRRPRESCRSGARVGLVEEQRAGAVEQPARDLDAAAQTARELAHRTIGVLAEAEALDPLGGARRGLREVEQGGGPGELLAATELRI